MMRRRPDGSLGRLSVAPGNDPVTPQPNDGGELLEIVHLIVFINPSHSARVTELDTRPELLGCTFLQVGSPVS